MSSEGVAAAAGVAAEGALEGLLARVQLDVSQKVTLLREGNSTLVALEGPVACRTVDECEKVNTPIFCLFETIR